MLKNIFLILSICIFFFGCKHSRKNNGIMSEYLNEEKNEIIVQNREEALIRLKNYPNYNEEYKYFSIFDIDQIKFIEEYSQDELSEYIERLYISIIDVKNPKDTKRPEDFEFIKNFNLKELTINYIGNVSIEPLRYLINLEELKLYDAKNIDLSPISDLKKLVDLRLCYNEFKDISPISNLENLEYLYLLQNKIVNMDPIYDITSLKGLNFDWQDDVDITHIGKLQNLEYLQLPFLTQENLNLLVNLKRLRKLETFSFTGNDISPLLELSNLEFLGINYNRSIDYSPLATINTLKKIVFDWSSYDDMTDFRYNKMSIFEENNIYIPPGDWR